MAKTRAQIKQEIESGVGMEKLRYSNMSNADMLILIEERTWANFEEMFPGIVMEQLHGFVIWEDRQDKKNTKSYILPDLDETLRLMKESVETKTNKLLTLQKSGRYDLQLNE